MSTRFARPASLAEALPLLAAGGWAVLAGGTDIYPAHVGESIGAGLLDITGIAGLRGIRRTDSGWSIGAATTWTDVLRADLPPIFAALQQAAREVGGVQIQNVGTVAGNLCNASPAADGTPALLALQAEVVLHRAAGERRVPVSEFVLGSRRTVRGPDELVVSIEVPEHSPGARSVFLKLGGRRYLTISITSVAVLLERGADDLIVQARAAVGSCSASPRLLPALEARLVGQPVGSLASLEIGAADLEPLAPLDDLRGSRAYRLDATATLLCRAFKELAT